MEVRDDGLQLGWEGDDGYGDLLLERLLAGTVSVLFEPVAVLDDDDVAALRASAGRELTVFDTEAEPRCNLRVVAVFETTWGQPDPRLVAGDGYGRDTAGWRRDNEASLGAALAATGSALGSDTVLLVQRVEVVARAG